MNKIELALHQLDTEIIKNENDLSFKMPITPIEKEEKSDTPETTPPIPKGKLKNKEKNSIEVFFNFS
jgi:hypothetical protein